MKTRSIFGYYIRLAWGFYRLTRTGRGRSRLDSLGDTLSMFSHMWTTAAAMYEVEKKAEVTRQHE